MLQVSTWVRVVVAAILLAGFAIALPNALPDSVRSRIPAWLPNQTVSLGLDLQGGSHLLLEVELDSVTKDKLESLTGDIRRALRKAHPPIGYRFGTPGADSISIQILDPARYDDAKSLIQALNPTPGGGVLAVGAKAYDFTDNGQGHFTLKMTDIYKTQTRQEILKQSIEVVRKRIDALGTREPAIERQGDERIVVEVPGLSDPKRLIDNLGKTAKMTFQLVDEAAQLKVIDPRTVGPGLGSDQIKAGRLSAIAGLILVALFMIARYGLFGIFADIALTLNVVLLLAALTLFNATLTLPGIAGIVLTMGMADDANRLIYHAIREKQRNGRPTPA